MTRRELFKKALTGIVAAPLAKAAEPVKEPSEEVTEDPIVEIQTTGTTEGTMILCTFVYESDAKGKWSKSFIRNGVIQT